MKIHRILLQQIALLISVALFAHGVYAITAKQERKELIARIKPVGQVHITDETQNGKTPTIDETKTVSASTQTLSAEQIYNNNCALCHNAALAGAPIPGDAVAWKTRQEKGFQQLLTNVINGFNAMPKKGNCPTCTDKQLEDVIRYMLPKNNE